MKVSKNNSQVSKYQTHENPKRQSFLQGTILQFLTSIVAKHQKIEGETLW